MLNKKTKREERKPEFFLEKLFNILKNTKKKKIEKLYIGMRMVQK